MQIVFNPLAGRFDFVGTTSTTPNFADAEIPSGVINSSNVTFTLANIPNPAGSLVLILGGNTLQQGAGKDYTLSGLTITMTTPPPTGETWTGAWYRY